MSLPTPIAVIGAFVAGPQAELERRYEARLLDELARIVDAVPAEGLAGQWDCAVEFALFEGVFPSWFGADYPTQLEGVVQRLIRLGKAVPEAVDLGYHLCYGDFGHRHSRTDIGAVRSAHRTRAGPGLVAFGLIVRPHGLPGPRTGV
ncbi:hypothetical protein [Nocardia brevicatena]|uniref:hypothetical protein n=1 Tax=Nocardia brevicatena TaxID=37327 RepID=UPI00030A498A|nr:hypothetical protein [Nocardia brevicatena]